MIAPNTPLLGSRFFLPLFLTQFLGAFNDNAFKLAMLTTISYHLSTSMQSSEQYQALAGALYILPFFLFSATAGELADNVDKARMTRVIKCLEVLLMLIGGLALWIQSIPLLLITLTGMGTHSTFFGPVKFAILPDHIPEERLLEATGFVEGSTWIAILAGTTLGALAIGSHTEHPGIAMTLTLSAALAGLGTSQWIPPAPPHTKSFLVSRNIWRATRTLLRDACSIPGNMPVFLTISWFWMIGAVMLTKLPDYVHYVLGAETTVFAIFLAIFSIGVGIGSVSVNGLLRGKARLQHIPPLMLALSVFSCDLFYLSPGTLQQGPLLSAHDFFSHGIHWRITVDFLLFSIFSGMCIVPLYTWLQIRNAEDIRSRIISANNILNSLFIVLGSVAIMILAALNATIASVFLVLGLCNALATTWIWKRLQRCGSYTDHHTGLS